MAGSGELSVFELKGGVKAPQFELGRTTPQEYRKALDEATTPQAELVSPHAILTVDVPSALQWRGEDQTALTKGYESIIARHNATAGLTSTSGVNRPVRLPHHLVLRADNQGTDVRRSQGLLHDVHPAARRGVAAARRARLAGLAELGHQ